MPRRADLSQKGFDRLVVTRSDHRDEETTGGLVVSELPVW
jgi:hypothetical protein